jgi:hypothetical protein
MIHDFFMIPSYFPFEIVTRETMWRETAALPPPPTRKLHPAAE